MSNEKNRNIERWLAIGLLAALVLLLIAAVFVPVVGKWIALREEKDQLAIKLRQYERILAGKDAVVKGMGSVKEAIQAQNYFNSQTTEALASAEVQEFIKKAIVDAGGKLSSTQALPVRSKDNFSLLTVSVRMTGNSEVLRSVLYRLETSAPLIIIDQLDIRPMRGVRNRRTRQIEQTNDLNINFQAVSFMRKKTE
ncbi:MULTISPECIES: type II secretion system protein GspM [Methylomicrobium]|uniref:General secretion pathway protein M n=1 Tax=Methylomicrobium album BG8 TaxID=686340 RepID=H8GIG0_METAL|nr:MULTISPECIES: type II secretion system protein GspM [Methylomicrobium]EIC31472.1 General secretion pathway protein M [Methylomicrobium album BG8]